MARLPGLRCVRKERRSLGRPGARLIPSWRPEAAVEPSASVLSRPKEGPLTDPQRSCCLSGSPAPAWNSPGAGGGRVPTVATGGQTMQMAGNRKHLMSPPSASVRTLPCAARSRAKADGCRLSGTGATVMVCWLCGWVVQHPRKPPGIGRRRGQAADLDRADSTPTAGPPRAVIDQRPQGLQGWPAPEVQAMQLQA